MPKCPCIRVLDVDYTPLALTHESECKKAGGDQTSDVRLRDAVELGRGEVGARKADRDEAAQCRMRA